MTDEEALRQKSLDKSCQDKSYDKIGSTFKDYYPQ